MSVFSGLYPPEHGVMNEGGMLGDHPTFAELLTDEGYSTAAFFQNTWLRLSGALRGFPVPEIDNAEPPLRAKIGEAISSVSPKIEITAQAIYRAQKLYRHWQTSDETPSEVDSGGQRTIERALTTLETVETPFCWFVHLNEAHWPYTPPSPYHRAFSERDTLSLVANRVYWQQRVYDSPANRLRTTAGRNNLPEAEIETFKNLYRGGIRYCDALVEQLVVGLKSKGVWDNTILVVFGDHGDSFGERGVFGHQLSVDDSIIRVPLMIRDPTGQLEQGSISAPVSLADVYPTVLELTDIDGPETNSRSLLDTERDYTYTYYDATNLTHLLEVISSLDLTIADLPPLRQYAVWKSPKDKAVWYPDHDRWGGPSANDELLRSELKDHMQRLRVVQGGQKEGMNNAVAERLKDMGYLQ